MKVVLAEKPSVARDIAAVLGATSKKEGYLEGNGYAVTYAFGHLVTISEPETMNTTWGKPWRLEQLPMLPTSWKYEVAEKANSQFQVIKKLFLDPSTTSIICATDAGREGEHIFRLIYGLSGCKKPVERLWISSLTSESIRDGLSKLRPSKDFDNLADAAMARAHADWVVGLNFTRAYTTLNNQLCTIGRVQTPTLALIVNRQAEIDKFQSVPFSEILASFESGFIAKYIEDKEGSPTRLKDKSKAENVLKLATAASAGTVESIKTEEKATKAPGLYDLLTLQKDANRRFGYTAQETLDIAQNLYEEHKLLSYPRTESRHLSNDMVAELPKVLSSLLKSSSTTSQVRELFAREEMTADNITPSQLETRLSKSYVDDTKLTDHHAIIPTARTANSELPEKQRNVYMLVVTRFLSIFLPAERRAETTAIIRLADHLFQANGIVIQTPGWTALLPKSEEKQTDDKAQVLPALTENQKLPVRKAEIKEGKTTAPKPYDDASLLTAMKNAGQELDDEDLASHMKQSGLGTPATRAAIIERLIHSGYVERSKKAIVPTVKGTELIGTVHADLKNIALTASWEQRLHDMQDGKLPLTKFEADIASFVSALLPAVTIKGPSMQAIQSSDSIGKCPQCKEGFVRPNAKVAGCSRWREGCKFAIWREQHGKKLTDAQIIELLEKKQTKPIKGFKKKDGSGTYDARLILDDEFKVKLDFGAPAKR
jgi:DNA topoisomerase III